MKPIVWLTAAVVGLSGCQDRPRSETAADKVSPTPEPPYGRALFASDVAGSLQPSAYDNRIPPASAAPASCGTKVTALDVHTSGTVRGRLKYNALPRANINAACLNNNATLGSCRKPGALAIYFKFEVEVTFEGPLRDGFYGQLITRTSPDAANDNDVEFTDDTPKNDWAGKAWFLKSGEKKEDFPTVEVEGQTVRWIDSPQANPVNPVKAFVIV